MSGTEKHSRDAWYTWPNSLPKQTKHDVILHLFLDFLRRSFAETDRFFLSVVSFDLQFRFTAFFSSFLFIVFFIFHFLFGVWKKSFIFLFLFVKKWKEEDDCNVKLFEAATATVAVENSPKNSTRRESSEGATARWNEVRHRSSSPVFIMILRENIFLRIWSNRLTLRKMFEDDGNTNCWA